MKKITKFFFAALAVYASASCTKEIEPATAEQELPEGYRYVTLDVRMDDITKGASLGTDLSVIWEVGDSVMVLNQANAAQFKFKVSSVDGTNAKIYGAIDTTTTFVAVYPYTACAAYDNETGLCAVLIPDTQTIPAGKNIDPKALISVARGKLGQTIEFKNVVSLMKFNISGSNYSSVVFEGNNSENFVGRCTETEVGGALSPASSRLTIKAENGTFAAGDYYAAICPATFETGFKTGVFTGDNSLTVKTGSTQASFKKNGGLKLGDLITGGTKVPTDIKAKEDLVLWAANCQFFPAGTNITLSADIDLSGVAWKTPTSFIGNFDGQNHRVYNIVASSAETNNVGFLGIVGDGTDTSTVKNLCVGSQDYDFSSKTGTYDGTSKFTFCSAAPIVAGTVKGTFYYPGLVCYLHKNSLMDNVANFVTIDITEDGTANRRVGGVAGTMKDGSVIQNCINFGTITDNGTLATKGADCATLGGIVGGMDGQNCRLSGNINRGKITVNNEYNNSIGGITGINNKVATVIENCENYGAICISKVSITSGAENNFGGITSYFHAKNVVISGCKNHGALTCKPDTIGAKNVNIAGIAGRVGYSATTAKVIDCHNYGNIELSPTCAKVSANTMVGGIVGYFGSESGLMEDCTNEGAISRYGYGKNSYMGGILGYAHGNAKKAVYKNCSNKGVITSGSFDTGNAYVGGVFGFTTNETAAGDAMTVTNCDNEGNVVVGASIKAYTYFGGVAGYFGTNTNASDCDNSGLITPAYEHEDTDKCARVGGVAGGLAGSLENCTNKGDIYFNPGSAICCIQAGGITSGAYAPQKITKCTNTGTITVENCTLTKGLINGIGSITGLLPSTGVYTDCVAGGEIIVNAKDSTYVGGFAGHVSKNTTADITFGEGCNIDVKITVAEERLPYTGMVIGFWNTASTKSVTIGSTSNPVKVKGSLNNTTVTAGNLATLINGSNNAPNPLFTINAELAQ